MLYGKLGNMYVQRGYPNINNNLTITKNIYITIKFKRRIK